jgi:S-adenosylmethionine-diacylglycerol 3-amino-3-carboxypropyl transferase
VYLFGSYTPDCCPEYLKPHNFERLKGGLVDHISTHTSTITDFLQGHEGQINRYVLLDHMDWLSTFGKPLLQAEWQALLDHASADARFLWRSGGLHTDFVDAVEVRRHGALTRVGEILRYDRERAARLHSQDRVHTYGSFYIADLATA